MGCMADIFGCLSGRRIEVFGRTDRKFLRHDGDCIAIYAGGDGYNCRPLDSGAETAGPLPPDSRPVSLPGRTADGICSIVYFCATVGHVLYAHYRLVQLRSIYVAEFEGV